MVRAASEDRQQRRGASDGERPQPIEGTIGADSERWDRRKGHLKALGAPAGARGSAEPTVGAG